MPTYRFRTCGERAAISFHMEKQLPGLAAAREEAKRFGRLSFADSNLAQRVEVEELGAGTVLVVPMHEELWLDQQPACP